MPAEFPWEYEALADVPEKEYRFRRYEGYFFPDTYIFYKGMIPGRFPANSSPILHKIAGDLAEEIKTSKSPSTISLHWRL
jgi:UPF0755 protein